MISSVFFVVTHIFKIRHAKARTVGTQRYNMSCLMDLTAAQAYVGSSRQARLPCVVVDVGRVEVFIFMPMSWRDNIGE